MTLSSASSVLTLTLTEDGDHINIIPAKDELGHCEHVSIYILAGVWLYQSCCSFNLCPIDSFLNFQKINDTKIDITVAIFKCIVIYRPIFRDAMIAWWIEWILIANYFASSHM